MITPITSLTRSTRHETKIIYSSRKHLWAHTFVLPSSCQNKKMWHCLIKLLPVWYTNLRRLYVVCLSKNESAIADLLKKSAHAGRYFLSWICPPVVLNQETVVIKQIWLISPIQIGITFLLLVMCKYILLCCSSILLCYFWLLWIALFDLHLVPYSDLDLWGVNIFLDLVWTSSSLLFFSVILSPSICLIIGIPLVLKSKWTKWYPHFGSSNLPPETHDKLCHNCASAHIFSFNISKV